LLHPGYWHFFFRGFVPGAIVMRAIPPSLHLTGSAPGFFVVVVKHNSGATKTCRENK
jgi:hypothetical protein